MPIYEVNINGEEFEIDAPDDAAVQLAVRQLQGSSNPAKQQLDDYYSSGIYAGEYNPLGAIARSLDAGATSAGDVASFGFGDEIAGLWGGTEDQRNRQKALAESNPYATVAGAVGGGLTFGAGGLTRNAGGQIGGSQGLLSALPSANLPATASLGSRVLANGLEGAAMGATYGAGSGENAWDRFSGAVGNGLVGGAIGGAVPAITQGISGAYRNVADYFARNQVARDAGVSPEVANYLVRIGNNDGTLGTQGMANMARAGGEAMPVDAGINSQQALDWAIQRGGAGASLARQRIDDRLARGATDLNDALNASMGRPGESLSREVIVYGDKTNPLSLLYKRAYAQPIDYADPLAVEIEGMIRNRVPKSAIDEANNLMRVEGVESQQILANVADDGTVVFETLPDVRQLDYITRGLNEVADKADGQGKLGGTTAMGRAYGNLSREIRSRLKQLVPEYETALNRAGTEIGKVKATEFGDTLLSDGVTRSQVSDFVKEIPNAERNSLKQAVRQNIDDRVARVRAAFTDPNVDAREAASAIKTMSSRANREKLSAVLGDKEANALFDELDRIFPSFGLKASVAQNSKTFTRTAAEDVANELVAPNPIERLMDLEPVRASQGVAQILTGRTPERLAARKDAFASEIADYLTRPASQAIPQFQAMGNYGAQMTQNQLRSMRIAEILSGIRSGAYPASTQFGGFGE